MIEIYAKLAEKNAFLLEGEAIYIVGKRPKRKIKITSQIYDYLKNNKKIAENDYHKIFFLYAKAYITVTCEFQKDERPKISVIIPVKDRPEDLALCLDSLKKLNWQEDKLEIIVINDGGNGELCQNPNLLEDVKVVNNETSKGPAQARNRGAEIATGEVLAFIDSDCIAEENWLEELTPWLMTKEIGAIGGVVAGYYNQTPLDRYEASLSPLAVSNKFQYEANTKATFYVPTCNVLVKKSVFDELNGFNEALHLGEDVDFCWRMRNTGVALALVQKGIVWHKHRSDLYPMLKRRFQYGTSEADLYKRHQDKEKNFPLPKMSLLISIFSILGVLNLNLIPILLTVILLIILAVQKKQECEKNNLPITYIEALSMAGRTTYAFAYYACFHLIRYYLVLLLIIGIFIPKIIIFALAALIFSAAVDYFVHKPNLNYLNFLLFYSLEQVFYQLGVLAGCIKHKYFRSYLLKFI